MKLLLLGRNGQVGWELQRSLLPLGTVCALDRQGADLSRVDELVALVEAERPDVIVNAAAYTAVDQAETDVELAQRVNADAPAALARAARAVGALLVHYSTDYVFDGGKSSPYLETDATGPLNTYGRSKLAGEEGIRLAGPDHLILRTSWVYGARGSNFLLTMLRLMQERESLGVIADQVGAPTWSRVIADVTAQLVFQAHQQRHRGQFTSGTYHLTSRGSTSWHGFATAIAELSRSQGELAIRQIEPVAACDYPSPTRRPLNSRLDTGALQQRFSLQLPVWDQALALCIAELY